MAPDLLGVGSVFPLVQSHPDAERTVVRLHRLANEMSDLLCGRTTHPISLVVGGFSAIPTARQLAELRQKLLEADIQVFAEHGFRGATTRRIAEAAGVNEVTLFRHFKSKSAIISEAAEFHAQLRAAESLPEVPLVPLRELTEWAATQLDFLHASGALIRKCLAEIDEHPQMATCMHQGPVLALAQLRHYAERLTASLGLDPKDERVGVACTR